MYFPRMMSVVLCFITVPALGAMGAAPLMAKGKNIALHQPYTFSTAPNYHLSTDPDDKLQLTDGKFSDDGRALWIQKPTVGWKTKGKAISITIDLGKVYPIGGISFRSAGGGAVAFPAFIYIWVSDDGKMFTYGGELISASWRAKLPDSHGRAGALRGKPSGTGRYLASRLKLRGRYVKLTAYPAGSYLFSDEIEVFAGPFDPASVKPSTIRLEKDFEKWAKEHKYHAIAQVRMLYDLQELQWLPGAGKFHEEINALRQDVINMPTLDKLDMSKGLPYTPLHAKIWALNGKLQQAAGQKPFFIWPGRCYAPLHPYDTPQRAKGQAEVHLIGNEYRSAAINVSNFTDAPHEADVTLTWQDKAWPADAVQLRTVRFTETQERAIIAAALPDAKKTGPNRWQVDLPAGITSQLWLTFHSKNVPRGTYKANLIVRTDDGSYQGDLPITVQVHAGQLPDPPTLDAWTWDYLSNPPNYSLTSPANRDAAVALLREYLVRSHWLGPWYLPVPKRNPDGTIKSAMNFEQFDDWLDAVGPARRYFLYMQVLHSSLERRFVGKFKRGTPAYATGVQSYIRALADHIQARGLDKSRFVLCILDEPTGGKNDAVAAEYIRLAKQAEPEFVFFEDPMYKNISKVHRPLMEASDIICPKFGAMDDPELSRYYKTLVETKGKMLAGYECTDGGWLRSPAGYFRKMAWWAWRHGMKGIGVWAYMATRQPSSWDDFRAAGGYEMIFATPQTVTPSKILEAWREGIEDYEYFCILKSLVDEREKSGRSSASVKQARNVLDTLAEKTIPKAPGIRWGRSTGSTDSYETFDRARLELLYLIDKLTDETNLP